jgi:signal transduction histidine kinase
MPPTVYPLEEFVKAEKSPVEDVVAALRKVTPLEGMDERDYRWLAENGKELLIPPGQFMFHQDQPVEYMAIVLHGEIHVRRRMGNETNVFVGRAGEITGILPFSRMKTHGGDGVASISTWILAIHKDDFPRMLETVPTIKARLVGVLLDRVREVTRIEQQSEKLTALSKLAGNLAHELNNPASAAQRSAASLLQELSTYGMRKFDLGRLCLPDEKLEKLHAWQREITDRAPNQVYDSIGEADTATQLTNWLDARGAADAAEVAVMLAEFGANVADLDALSTILVPADLNIFLAQFASSLRTRRMTEAILNSTARIFDIINAIKDYSYLDQAPLQEVDVPQALRNTLVMLQSRLADVQIVEHFADNLPLITAFASELNQVWMALFENALDAMEDKGRLEISVFTDPEWMTVEVIDNGSGISPDIQSRIFEPFFTTKPPGKGLGLGLDTAMRILRKHRGHVAVDSRPGRTCFKVQLPLEQWRAY